MSRRTDMRQLKDEMSALAERIGREAFDTHLDYSVESIKEVERILGASNNGTGLRRQTRAPSPPKRGKGDPSAIGHSILISQQVMSGLGCVSSKGRQLTSEG